MAVPEGEPLWISEAEVVDCIDLPDAVGVLSEAFYAEGAGRAVPMAKTMADLPVHGTLHALGAVIDDVVGTKCWAHTPGGAEPLVLLFDAATGAVLAVIEAFALGQLRTAGTAALATDLLAAPQVDRMAVIGTGKQALAQVAAVAAVRQVREVRAYSRDPERRRAFAELVGAQLQVACTPATSVSEAIDGAGVITLITRATDPVLFADQVHEGTHINAVGAIDLARREIEPKLLGRAAMVVTDSLSQVQALSAELRDFYGPPGAAWAAVQTLGQVVHGERAARQAGDITVFKGMGSGVEDVAIGAHVLAQARRRGFGRPLPARRRAVARLSRTSASSTPGGATS